MGTIKDLRIARIKEILKDQQIIDVNVLSEMLSVSSTTIRNDLREMENQDTIYRMHGKVAYKNSFENGVHPRTISVNLNCEFTEALLYVGELAKQLVTPDEWIFIGCGFTCAAVAYALQDTVINVVTNNLYAATILMSNQSAQVMLTGGFLSGPSRSFLTGDILTDSLKGLSVTKAFVGAAGIDLKFGYSISNLVERSIFQVIRPIAREFIVVADSSKFGKTSIMTIGNMDVADCIVTDTEIPQEYADYCNQKGIRLITQ